MNPVKRLRLEKGLTQREMAERLGVDIRTYQRWEAKMSVSKKVLVSVMAAVSTLAGCGSSDSGSAKEPFQGAAAPAPVVAQEETKPTSYLVETEAELPKCETKSKGWLVFVNESSVFKACSGTEWKIVDLKGKDGAAGKDGVAGKDGTNGAQGTQGVAGAKGDAGTNGTDNKITSKLTCKNISWLIPNRATTQSFSYQLITYASGDTVVQCGVANGALQTQKTEFWAKGTVGATNGLCEILHDVDGTNDYDRLEFKLALDSQTNVLDLRYYYFPLSGFETTQIAPSACTFSEF